MSPAVTVAAARGAGTTAIPIDGGAGEGSSSSASGKANRPLHEQNDCSAATQRQHRGGGTETRDDREEAEGGVLSLSIIPSVPMACPGSPQAGGLGGEDGGGGGASPLPNMGGLLSWPPLSFGGDENQQQKKQEEERGRRSMTTTAKTSAGGAAAAESAEGGSRGGGGGLLDWFGTSCQSAYDAILLPGVEDEILAAKEREKEAERQKKPTKGGGAGADAVGAGASTTKVKVTRTTGLAKGGGSGHGSGSGGGNSSDGHCGKAPGNPDTGSNGSNNTNGGGYGSFPQSAAAKDGPTSGGGANNGGTAGGDATYYAAYSSPASRKQRYRRAQTAPPATAIAQGLLQRSSSDDSQSTSQNSDTLAPLSASLAAQYQASTAAAAAAAASSGNSSKGSSKRGGRGSINLIQRSSTTISDSFGQIHQQMGLRFNRSRSENSDPSVVAAARNSSAALASAVSPAAAASMTVAEVATAAARDAEQRRGRGGLGLGLGGDASTADSSSSAPPDGNIRAVADSSKESNNKAETRLKAASLLLPPLPPRVMGSKYSSRPSGRLAGENWSTMHDKLIEELFEERRRALGARRADDRREAQEQGNNADRGDHRHQNNDHTSFRGFKIGSLLPGHHGGGGGHGHGAHEGGSGNKDGGGASTTTTTILGVVKKNPSPAKGGKRSASPSKSKASEDEQQEGGSFLPALPSLQWGSNMTHKKPAEASRTTAGKGGKRRMIRVSRLVQVRRRGLKGSSSSSKKKQKKKKTKKEAAEESEGSSSMSMPAWLGGAAASGPQKNSSSATKTAAAASPSAPYSFLRVPSLARLSPGRRKPGENLRASSGGGADRASPTRVTFCSDFGSSSGAGGPDPNPGSYLSKKCRLQKDKGKGEVPGTAVSTVGRDEALDKLRQKVDVIVEVEQSSSAAASKAKLKLKPAVLVDPWVPHASFQGTVETRSIIAVKMGFLSMKYGILLRWDVDSGLVSLIVLRKMCPPGFLDGTDDGAGGGAETDDDDRTVDGGRAVAGKRAAKEADAAAGGASTPPRTSAISSSPSKRKAPSSAIKSRPGLIINRLVDGANAILHGRWDSDGNGGGGTEVALLGPPFLVERPEKFPDATLSVTVLRARGLCGGDNKRADWVMNPYVRLSLGGDSHKTGAVKMTCNPTWTKANHNQCRLRSSNNPKEDDTHLKVEVYDWRPFRRDRILGVVFVPVASVEPQKGDGKAKSDLQATEVTIPVRMMRNKKGPYGCVTLSLVHRNAYWCWLREELKARGKEMSR